MTAEVVNLRRARKAKGRATRAEEAAANRVAHGLTRTEKTVLTLEKTRAARTLDGHRMDGDKADAES